MTYLFIHLTTPLLIKKHPNACNEHRDQQQHEHRDYERKKHCCTAFYLVDHFGLSPFLFIFTTIANIGYIPASFYRVHSLTRLHRVLASKAHLRQIKLLSLHVLPLSFLLSFLKKSSLNHYHKLLCNILLFLLLH